MYESVSVYINIKTGIAPVKIDSAEYKGKSWGYFTNLSMGL